MAVRTRKSTSTLPSEPVAEPATAPTRRRVPGTRAAATRRPATSSRTLRPILPPEPPAAEPSPEPLAEPVAEAPIADPPAAQTAPVLSEQQSAAPESEPEVAAESVAAPVAEAPALESPAEVLLIAIETPAPDAAAEVLLVAVETSAPDADAETLLFAPAGEASTELPTEVLVVAPADEASSTAVPDEGLGVAAVAELPALDAVAAPAAALPLLVEQLQADVRALQGLVTDRTELTVQELGRTTMQMVRMVTGVAHHLDQLAEQVQQLSGAAQTLAQALTRVECTVATLHSRTQDQILLAARGQRELQDGLSPVLSELVALRTQAARNTSIDRLDQFRMGVELKQLRQAVEKHGPTPELVSALPRPARAPRTKR